MGCQAEPWEMTGFIPEVTVRVPGRACTGARAGKACPRATGAAGIACTAEGMALMAGAGAAGAMAPRCPAKLRVVKPRKKNPKTSSLRMVRSQERTLRSQYNRRRQTRDGYMGEACQPNSALEFCGR